MNDYAVFFQAERISGLYDGEPLGSGGAVAEIAGRDSIGAVVASARSGGLVKVLPTMAYTGTEYGDIQALFGNVQLLRELLEPQGTEVLDPIVLGSPLWWRATIGRPNSILTRRYGPWHICVGCHMYLHAVRVGLAWEAGTKRIIAGERYTHSGKAKINQTRPAVEAYMRTLLEWGIELEAPLLELDDDETIMDLTGEWEEGARQPGCVFAGNYKDLQGRTGCDYKGLNVYLEDYLVPVTRAILVALKERGRADYQAIVGETLR